MNKQAENDKEVITKAYVDQFHQEYEQSRRDVGLDFYDESNDLVKNHQGNILNDNKLINLDDITASRKPNQDNELLSKKNIDDELDKINIDNFNQTPQNHPKVSVGSDTYNLTQNDKIQLTDQQY